jgi:hypothetical protein
MPAAKRQRILFDPASKEAFPLSRSGGELS